MTKHKESVKKGKLAKAKFDAKPAKDDTSEYGSSIISNSSVKTDETAPPPKVQKKLGKLRDSIDQADRDLLKAFAKRMKAVEQVGKLKHKYSLPIVQPERWKEVVENRVKRGNKLKIGEKFLREVLELIHEESVHIQQRGKK
jgi:chorismate mutase